MSRIQNALANLGRPAFIPFLTAGDPDLQTTAALVSEAVRRGADMVEIGVPFSDPVADGPVIQDSYARVLASGFKVDSVFALACQLRQSGCQAPLIAMISYSLIFRRGVEEFVAQAARAGFDGLIVPDLPAGYQDHLAQAARARNLDLILLCAPTTTPQRKAMIAARASGFIYYISVAGITGTRDALPEDLGRNVRALKAMAKVPVCVGFGISRPEQAAAVAAVADGAIVGSALVRAIASWTAQGAPRQVWMEAFGQEVERFAQAVSKSRQDQGARMA